MDPVEAEHIAEVLASVDPRPPWACPKCGHTHLNSPGFHCMCEGHNSSSDLHGTYVDPCPRADCKKCKWSGVFPELPKDLPLWAQIALKNNWIPPHGR